MVTSACGSGSTSTGLAIGGRLRSFHVYYCGFLFPSIILMQLFLHDFSGLWKLTTGFAVCDNERYFME